MGNRCADHTTALYQQKLALSSPTNGGRSVGIVRFRTKIHSLFLCCQAFDVHNTLSQYSHFTIHIHPTITRCEFARYAVKRCEPRGRYWIPDVQHKAYIWLYAE
jgi:hypothetical protein